MDWLDAKIVSSLSRAMSWYPAAIFEELESIEFSSSTDYQALFINYMHVQQIKQLHQL